MLEKQNVTNGVAQNVEILDLNDDLKLKLTTLENRILVLVKELQKLRAEKQEKEDRKNARAKRKPFPRRDPITPEIYERLIENIGGTDYCSARLRLVILLLTITGIRINELLLAIS